MGPPARHNTFLLLDGRRVHAKRLFLFKLPQPNGEGMLDASSPTDPRKPTVGHAALVCECVHDLVVVQVDGTTGARDELVVKSSDELRHKRWCWCSGSCSG